MDPLYVLYVDAVPRNVPDGVRLIQQDDDHSALFAYLSSEISMSTTVSFSSFANPLQTLLQSAFSEQFALQQTINSPNVSLYELEGQTIIDLLGAEDQFESHYQRPEFRTVKLSSRRDVRAIFKLARMLSQNFEDDQPVLGESSSVCRFLISDRDTCRSVHICSNEVLQSFQPEAAQSIRHGYFAPIMKMSKNIFVMVANGAEEITKALAMCSIDLKSREITLSLQPSELQLTPIDDVLKDYDEALELSKLEEQSASQDREYVQSSQIALQQSVQHIIESGIADNLIGSDILSIVEPPQTSAEKIKQVNFQEPMEMYREFSDQARQQESEQHDDEDLLPLKEA